MDSHPLAGEFGDGASDRFGVQGFERLARVAHSLTHFPRGGTAPPKAEVFVQFKSYWVGMRIRLSSRTSRKPRVVMRPVSAPSRSMMALVATVVPWATSVQSPADKRFSASRFSSVSRMPRS